MFGAVNGFAIPAELLAPCHITPLGHLEFEFGKELPHEEWPRTNDRCLWVWAMSLWKVSWGLTTKKCPNATPPQPLH